MKYLKYFLQLNEGNRVKIILHVVEWWLDRDYFILYKKEDSVDEFYLLNLDLVDIISYRDIQIEDILNEKT